MPVKRAGHQREGVGLYVWHGKIIGEREGSLVKRGDHQREGVVAYDIRRSLVKGGVAGEKGRSPQRGSGRL